MFDKFPAEEFYSEQKDASIPRLINNNNIILTQKGLQKLAWYYKKKYSIEIIPFFATVQYAPFALSTYIRQIRNAAGSNDARCGFVFSNGSHTMPVLWEKQGPNESLFFLDSTQYLGDISYVDYRCELIFLPEFHPNITDISSLKMKANCAYIFTGYYLFYMDKKNNMCKKLLGDLNAHKLAEIRRYIGRHFPKLILEETQVLLTEEQILYFESAMEWYINQRGRAAFIFRKQLSQLEPKLQCHSLIGKTQLDASSCSIAAMVMLKDGLRIQPSLKSIIQTKIKEHQGGLILFYLPEELLKTAQAGSFAEKSMADLDKPMHQHFTKDAEGKRTGQSEMQNLKFFKKTYLVTVHEGKHAEKQFNTFTLQKGVRYKDLLAKLWDAAPKETPKEALREQDPKVNHSLSG